MTVLPIVERELRVAARRRSTYRIRTLSAGAAVALFGLIYLSATRASTQEFGSVLFVTLSLVFFSLSLFLGAVYTSDCLSEEKREGTLGLLFLTDLRGYDVIFGKLVASSVNAFYSMLAILPVLAVPLLIGGVAPAEFWRLVAVLLNTLFFSLSLGVFVSSIARNARRAMLLTLILVILINGFGPAWGAYYASHTPGSRTVPVEFLISSAGYACALVHDSLYSGHSRQFAVSLAVTHGLAWVCLILASIAVRYSWQERATGPIGSALRRRYRQWVYGGAHGNRQQRQHMLELNPCYWLGSRQRLKPLWVWGFLLVLAGFWLAGYLKWPDDWISWPIFLLFAWITQTVLKLWMASDATSALGPDRRSGALELLLSTPLTERDIALGHLQSLQRQFLGPGLFLLVFSILALGGGLREFSGNERMWVLWFCLSALAMFVLDMVVLGWLGMWLGFQRRHSGRAMIQTVFNVLLLPWFAMFGVLLGMQVFGIRIPNDAEPLLLGLYWLVGGGISAAFGITAYNGLTLHLRHLTAEPLRTRSVKPEGQPGAASTSGD